jgi:hypothetical protein
MARSPRQIRKAHMIARRLLLVAALCGLATGASAQTASRIRGTLASVEGTVMHVTPNEGGDAVLTLAPDARVTLVEPTTLAEVKPGSFIGTAAKTQDDGTMVAVEVHVFPESMRGSGEGHRPFDLGPKSTMTNGTVGQEVVGATGQTLTVRYKGGEKSIVVPKDAPIVTFAPGDRALLVKGAHVIVFGQKAADGSLAAGNVLVGKDGLVPPM